VESTTICIPDDIQSLDNDPRGAGAERMTATHKKDDSVDIRPRVGIFWLYGRRLIIDSVPVSEAEVWGSSATTRTATNATGATFSALELFHRTSHMNKCPEVGSSMTAKKSSLLFEPTAAFSATLG
jgi:hypothetical protein